MTDSLDLSWTAALRRLRHYCPTDLAVRVRRRRLGGYDNGTCERKKKVYQIEVDSSLEDSHQLIVLTHEWAHAMAWPLELGWGHEHTSHFGICWVRSYNAVFDPKALP